MSREILRTKPILDFVGDVIYCLHDCKCGCDLKKEFEEAISKDKEKANIFFNRLENVRKELEQDLAFFMESDPAVDNEEEVIFAYPGYRAIAFYRVAHIINDIGHRFEARVISEHAHFLTGIDIHPGANIGSPFFIDHGTGIVIGETTIIGHHVKMYQGVTLGAISLGKGAKLKGTKRHPTIGNYVTIYSGASILGGDVTIGNNVIIGSNVYLIKSIEDNHRVVLSEPQLILIKK